SLISYHHAISWPIDWVFRRGVTAVSLALTCKVHHAAHRSILEDHVHLNPTRPPWIQARGDKSSAVVFCHCCRQCDTLRPYPILWVKGQTSYATSHRSSRAHRDRPRGHLS